MRKKKKILTTYLFVFVRVSVNINDERLNTLEKVVLEVGLDFNQLSLRFRLNM